MKYYLFKQTAMFKEGKIRQLLVPVLVFLTIGVNYLADALPINGLTTKELSDAIKIFFVPAGYAFSIWGVIYLGLIAYAVYQAQPKYENAPWLVGIFDWFAVSCIANIGWIFLWHYQQVGLSVFAMLVLLISLIVVYEKLEIGRYQVSLLTKWAVHIPFSIYLGWISVATIVNISAALEVHDPLHVFFPGIFTAQTWAVIMIMVASVLGVAMLLLRKDLAFAGVLIWAFVAIYVKFTSSAEMVSATAIMAAVSLFSLATFVYFRPDGFMHEIKAMRKSKRTKA